MTEVVKLEGRVRLLGYGPDEVRIGDLLEQEVDLVQGMVNGHQWITVQDGRIQSTPTREELPCPTEDENMLPFWRRHQESDESHRMEQLTFVDDLQGIYSPSFSIQHLCGYYYTREKYEQEAVKLESYGFQCLRSRRDVSGRYWEIWYLPSLFSSAQGELKETIKGLKEEKAQTARAIQFLCRNISFGTLDVSIQRAAMTMDDYW
ncbi:MAG: hypothetical protein AAB407_01035 [Patescibacteria group bacterium]